MKNQIIILVLFLMPVFTFSQQLDEKNEVLKKDATKKEIRKADLNQFQNQNTNSSQMIKPCSEAERISNGIPDDFPRCLNTGNKRQDEDNYYKAQEVWIKNNPERFKKIKNTSL